MRGLIRLCGKYDSQTIDLRIQRHDKCQIFGHDSEMPAKDLEDPITGSRCIAR